MTQAELGAALGVSVRTIGNWESSKTVSRSRAGAINEVLGNNSGNPLHAASEIDLLLELMRRANSRGGTATDITAKIDPTAPARVTAIWPADQDLEAEVPEAAIEENPGGTPPGQSEEADT